MLPFITDISVITDPFRTVSGIDVMIYRGFDDSLPILDALATVSPTANIQQTTPIVKCPDFSEVYLIALGHKVS